MMIFIDGWKKSKPLTIKLIFLCIGYAFFITINGFVLDSLKWVCDKLELEMNICKDKLLNY